MKKIKVSYYEENVITYEVEVPDEIADYEEAKEYLEENIYSLDMTKIKERPYQVTITDIEFPEEH